MTFVNVFDIVLSSIVWPKRETNRQTREEGYEYGGVGGF